MRSQAGGVVNALFEHYFDNFDTIPALFLENDIIQNSRTRNIENSICLVTLLQV